MKEKYLFPGVLEEAIKKAHGNGWRTEDSPDCLPDGSYNYRVLIFNHEFAKALWGEKPSMGAVPGYIDDAPQWQYHLILMVISDDPIKYLGDNLAL